MRGHVILAEGVSHMGASCILNFTDPKSLPSGPVAVPYHMEADLICYEASCHILLFSI